MNNDLHDEFGYINSGEADAELEKISAIPNVREKLIIEHEGVEYQVRTKDLPNFSSVGAVANWQFNLRLRNYLDAVPDKSDELEAFANVFATIYDNVYKVNKVSWIGADDKLHTVQVESVLETLYEGMKEKERVIKQVFNGQD